MRSSTSNPTVDSLEGDGELRVEQGRDSIWSGCQKAPYSAPSPPPTLEARRGEKKDWHSSRRDMRQDKAALGPGHKRKGGARKIRGRGRDFPGGEVDRNPPANTGDTGSIPGPGRFYMLWSNWALEPQLLSLHAVTTEAVC